MMEIVLAAASAVTSVTLAAGLLLWAQGPSTMLADRVIDVGLAVLMAMPVARLLAAVVAETRAREWRYVALGVVTLLLLGGSVTVALLYRL